MQLDFFDIPSPCVGVCQSDKKGLCRGCMRTRNERQEWKHFNNDEKQKVIKRCIQRTKRKNNPVKAKLVEPLAEVVEEKMVQPSLLEPISQSKISTKEDLDFGDFEL